MRQRSLTVFVFTFAFAFTATAATLSPRQSAAAVGLGINMPLVARLTGAGNTLYITSLDVSNHSLTDVQVDFYLDGVNQRTQTPVILTGSVTRDGLRQQGGGTLRARSNAHFSDFFASLVSANMLSADALADGLLGSVLFVFNGLNRSGQASVTARFRNDLAGGTVGVALQGREITSNEPQQLVAAIRDSSGNTSGEPKLYPNLFINHIGLTAGGIGTSQPVTVELHAVSNTTGADVGVPMTVTIASGNTAVISSALRALQVPPGDDTVLVYARVTSGNGAIQGIVSQVDSTTRDGSVFEMSRADF